MKKIILTFGLVAFLGLTAASCSTDDSALNNDASADTFQYDNGDKQLPKPPIRP